MMIKWKQQLKFVPNYVVQKTLQATTQLVPTVEETCEIMRDHYRPITCDPTSEVNNDMIKWKRQLGFVPSYVVQKTLQATTQLVLTVEETCIISTNLDCGASVESSLC